MDFEKKDNGSILLLLVVPGITNLLSILQKPRWQLAWVKPWLQRGSIKSVYHTIISELKLLQDYYDYRKHFGVNSESHFFKFPAFSYI